MNDDAYKYIRYNASQETRWATAQEIKRSCSYINLNDDSYSAAGLPIISDGKEAYVDNTDTHSLIFGATGSKKTRIFCMPMINMMAKAGESFIVTDPKGELYAQSSGLVKKKGYKTVVLNFRDIGTGDKWNPLSIPYERWRAGDKDEAGALLSDIVTAISSPLSNNTKDAYWTEAAQEMAIAGFYVLMETGKEEEINMKSFANISSQANIKNIKSLASKMREDSIAAVNYNSTACLKADQTVAGIVGALNVMLKLFTVNEKLCQMLSETSFDMRRIGREKTAVYVIVPDEKTSYHFLVTMFLKQIYEILISEAQKEKSRALPIRVNFVLDEFCNIPHIPDMPSMISAARSRNMRYFLVVQSMHQLKGRYGEDADTIKGNCDNWVFLTSKELDLLNEISELCGNIVLPDGRQRRLISTSELQRFDKSRGEALIMHARHYPIISEMADISQYSMFGIYKPNPIKPFAKVPVSCFSMTRLLESISKNEVLAPFASESQMYLQAEGIYQEEIKKLKAEVDDDVDKAIVDWITQNVLELDESTVKKSLDYLNDGEGTDAEEEARLKKLMDETKDIQMSLLEARKKEIEEMAKAKAYERISSLMGKEYADGFFDGSIKKPYEDSDDDDDDDFDFFS